MAVGDNLATIRFWIRELEDHHGSARAAAAAHGIDPSYWQRLREGEKTNPSAETLEKLGLRVAAVLYERAG